MNKLMKIVVVTCAVLLTGFNAKAQTEPKIKTIVIQTSAECEECEERIEGMLNYTKGVSFAELDLTNMKLTVKYKTATISEAQIKEKISKLGYDADEVKADPVAQNELPACCQPKGMTHEQEEGEEH
jgi:copper chaperone CopZ